MNYFILLQKFVMLSNRPIRVTHFESSSLFLKNKLIVINLSIKTQCGFFLQNKTNK